MIGLGVFCKDRYAFEKKLRGMLERDKYIIIIYHSDIQKTWANTKISSYNELKNKPIVVKTVKSKYKDGTFDAVFLMADSRSGNAKELLENVERVGKVNLNMLICNAKIHREKELPVTPDEVVKYISEILRSSNGKNTCGVKVKNVPGVRGGKTIDTDDPSTIARITDIVKENKSKTFFNIDLYDGLKKMCNKCIELYNESE